MLSKNSFLWIKEEGGDFNYSSYCMSNCFHFDWDNVFLCVEMLHTFAITEYFIHVHLFVIKKHIVFNAVYSFIIWCLCLSSFIFPDKIITNFQYFLN